MKRKARYGTPANRGAFSHETTHGIGFRYQPPPAPGWAEDPLAHRHTEARLGAAAWRHAAFERRTFASDWIATQIHPARVQAIGQTPVKPGDRDYVAAWWEEREQGCPAWKEEAA